MELPLILVLLSIVWTATATKFEPRVQVVELGTKFVFTCLLPFEGKRASELVWKEDGVKLVTGKRHTIHAHESQYGTLAIDRVETSDNGTVFTCSGTIRSGTIHSSVRLVVLAWDDLPRGYPMIYSGAADWRIRHSYSGNAVRLPCYVHGNPMPKATWFKDSIPIDRKDKRYSNITSSDLLIRNAQPEDSGIYECSAFNVHGKTISKPFELYVQKQATVEALPPSFLTALCCTVIAIIAIVIAGLFLQVYLHKRRRNARGLPIVNRPNQCAITRVTGPPTAYDLAWIQCTRQSAPTV